MLHFHRILVQNYSEEKKYSCFSWYFVGWVIAILQSFKGVQWTQHSVCRLTPCTFTRIQTKLLGWWNLAKSVDGFMNPSTHWPRTNKVLLEASKVDVRDTPQQRCKFTLDAFSAAKGCRKGKWFQAITCCFSRHCVLECCSNNPDARTLTANCLSSSQVPWKISVTMSEIDKTNIPWITLRWTAALLSFFLDTENPM